MRIGKSGKERYGMRERGRRVNFTFVKQSIYMYCIVRMFHGQFFIVLFFT